MTDESGGAIVAWADFRYGIDGISPQYNLYAQRVYPSGEAAALLREHRHTSPCTPLIPIPRTPRPR